MAQTRLQNYWAKLKKSKGGHSLSPSSSDIMAASQGQDQESLDLNSGETGSVSESASESEPDLCDHCGQILLPDLKHPIEPR